VVVVVVAVVAVVVMGLNHLLAMHLPPPQHGGE
jgi:hypothetical protein